MGAGAAYALRTVSLRARAPSRPDGRLIRVGADGLLGVLDRRLEPCAVPGEAAGPGLTWDEHDRSDPAWWPQGVAVLRSGSVLLVSWYAKRRRLRSPGARISVVDRAHPGGPRYRHVLLVRPRRFLGIPLLRPVPVHAGGIAVHGDLLYVADTLFGARLFRLGDVLEVRPGAGPRFLRRLRTHGHDHVLPQTMAVRVPWRAGWRRLRHSFLSIGEVDGRPTLVVGEYRRKAQGSARLVRYPLDPRTGLPSVDASGRVYPLEVHEDQPHRMQGAAVHGSTWFVTASAGEDVPGDLYAGAPGSWVRHRRVLPTGPEDVAWSRPGEELWCVSEWPGRRWVFPIATRPWHPAQRDATER